MTASSNLLVSTVHGTPSGNYDGSSTTFYSDKIKGDGYYGYADGLHTAAYFTTTLVGIITLQATLATDPASTDWFDISGTTYGSSSVPTTMSQPFNFTGNFVWIRAKITNFTAGSIGKVVVVQ